MGVHICVFVGLLALWMGYRRKWRIGRRLSDDRGRRLFILVAVGWNLVGQALSIESSHRGKVSQVFQREELGYEKELTVEMEGDKIYELTVQIPEREGQEVTEQQSRAQPPSVQQQIQEEVARYNQEKDNPEKYYLPQTLNGHKLTWDYAADHTGSMLSAVCLISAAALLIFQEREKENVRRKQAEQLLQDYPGLVMKFTLMMQAGMSVQGGFQRMAQDYERRIDGERKRRLAYEEIRRTCLEMDSGVSQVEAYRNFGLRCGQIKYKTFATLLVQNLCQGSQGLLQMLERESLEAWEDRKRKAKVLGEIAATKLLVPMILMLGVVLALLMIPAFLSFYGN